MKLDNKLVNQVFSTAIAVILIAIFFTLLRAGMLGGIENMAQSVMTPLMLVIIAVICLAIFSTLANIEYKLSKKR